jgi:hypothetical protein
MGITDEDIEWAEAEIQRLGKLYEPGSVVTYDQGRGNFIEAVEFLRMKAGARSEFYLRALDATKRMHASSACTMVRFALNGWIEFAQRGLVELPVEAQYRQAAATDLMEQVEQLLQDKKVVPAAPVMLAGAALEELLRAIVDTAQLKPRAKPSINTYATALRAAELITAQEMKDITAWAGLRNDAAHGHFERIELANARLMQQGINLFMQKHVAA